MRIPTLHAVAAVALAAALAATVAAPRLDAEAWPIAIRAAPVPLDAGAPDARRVGRLLYRAGFHLTSDHEHFGGFSGLVVGADGRMVAVSDEGHWLAAELRFAADGTLEGIEAGRMGPLCDDDGAPVAGKERNDAEELLELPGRGLLVSFEHHHRLALYESSNGGPSLDGAPRPFPFPPAILTTRSNKGMEAVAMLADGRLLTFTEDLRTIEDDVIGWVGRPEVGDWQLLTLRDGKEFLPTGAAILPSGDVLLLERSYAKEVGNRVRLSVIEPAGLIPDGRLEPLELALLEPPATVDNFEAVAVAAGPRGEVLVYLLSDDNFNAHQRTLLLQLELLDATSRP